MQAFAEGWAMQAFEQGSHYHFFMNVLQSSWFSSLHGVMKKAGIRIVRQVDDELMSAGRFYWNFFARLFHRQRKYAARGITIVDSLPSFARIAQSIRICNM